jgi:hypothetical protein
MDMDTLLLQGRELIAQTTQAHSDRWGLGTAQRWVLDQDQGRITWSFPDRIVSADAQILGSWNGTVNSFVWSWDNESIQDKLCTTAARARAFGVENDVVALSSSPLNLDESQARDLVALAFRLGDCTGLYHPYDGKLATYIAFGAVTIEEPGGVISTFEATQP